MSVNHDAVAVSGVSGGAAANKTLLREMFVSRFPYILESASEAQNLIAVDPDTGAVIQDLMLLGRAYHYDDADGSTPHDGTTCLVSFEGKRYKLATGTDVLAWSVINATTTSPPASPTNGDAYIVAAAATGAWSGKDGKVAVYTARGWEFVDYGIGRLIYDETNDTYYHRNAAGTWVEGIGNKTVLANSVPLASLPWSNASAIIRIINDTTNSPPASPSVGDAYIIGSSPTGDWSGHAADVAICESSGVFTIYDPAIGDQVYNIALGYMVEYTASGWVGGVGGVVVLETKNASSSSSIDFDISKYSSLYTSFEIIIEGVKLPATGYLLLRVGTGSGPTWQAGSTAYYSEGASGVSNGSYSYIYLGGAMDALAGVVFAGDVKFNRPAASEYFSIMADSRVSSAGAAQRSSVAGQYKTVSAITGIRFLSVTVGLAAQNISSGKFTLRARRQL